MATVTRSKFYWRDLFTEPIGHGRTQIKWDVYQALAIVAGVIMIFIYASRTQGWYTFGVCTLIAAVALAFGLLFGFLFGIPKAAQEDPNKPAPAQPPVGAQQAALQPGAQPDAQAQVGQLPAGAQQQVGQQAASQLAHANQPKTPPAKSTSKANTNLVEISDWLTKMIVGVGLYQLSTLPGKLRSVAGYFATAFGEPAAPPALVMAILGYFAIFGFLLGYLWARIYLTKEFDQPDDTAPQRTG